MGKWEKQGKIENMETMKKSGKKIKKNCGNKFVKKNPNKMDYRKDPNLI